MQSPVSGSADKRPYAHNGQLAYSPSVEELNQQTEVCVSVYAPISLLCVLRGLSVLLTDVFGKCPNISLRQVELRKLQEATRWRKTK